MLKKILVILFLFVFLNLILCAATPVVIVPYTHHHSGDITWTGIPFKEEEGVCRERDLNKEILLETNEVFKSKNPDNIIHFTKYKVSAEYGNCHHTLFDIRYSFVEASDQERYAYTRKQTAPLFKEYDENTDSYIVSAKSIIGSVFFLFMILSCILLVCLVAIYLIYHD